MVVLNIYLTKTKQHALERSLNYDVRTSVKSCPASAMQALSGRGYSFYSSLTLALDGVSGQRHALVALYFRGKDPPVPIG